MSVMTVMPKTRPAVRPVVAVKAAEILGRERRKKRRVSVPPMYSAVTVRILSSRQAPLEGHVIDISESGLSVELDELIALGSPVSVEFLLSGLGRMRAEEWPAFAATAEVTRHDDVDDFPQGPYRMALRFVKLPTMVQAQIARYVATRAPATH